MSGDEENDENEEDLVGKNDVNSNLDPEIEGLIRDALKTLVQEKFDSRKTHKHRFGFAA